MAGQLPVIIVVVIVALAGVLWLRRKYTAQAEDHMMAYFRLASGGKKALRVPFNGQWVIAPRKFKEKGTMRYGVREDATWDEWYPAGLPRIVQVKIKSIDYLEGDPEPFIKRDRLIPIEVEDESGQRVIKYVDYKAIVTPKSIAVISDEKAGDVAMRATAKIDELENKLAKQNPKLMTILLFVTMGAALGTLYVIFTKIMPLVEDFDKIKAALGI